jgi:hypothetical protein
MCMCRREEDIWENVIVVVAAVQVRPRSCESVRQSRYSCGESIHETNF